MIRVDSYPTHEKDGIKYLPTFHPAALLRDETKKIDFWNDLKKLNYN